MPIEKRRQAAALQSASRDKRAASENTVQFRPAIPAVRRSLLAACLVLLLPGTSLAAQPLRIGLVTHFKNLPEVIVSSTAEFRVHDRSGSTVATVGAAGRVTLRPEDRGMELSRADGSSGHVGSEVEVSSASPDAPIILSCPDQPFAQYRGKIIVQAGDKGLSLVNVVDIEEYLLGVLPSEMPASFNLEALKAQAVAARTFSWAGRGRHGGLGYDLCDSTHCQVYLGAAGEKPSTSEALNQTLGLVATYQGRLISAMYCSDCGGRTQDGGAPYLVSVPDRPEDSDGADHCERDGHAWTRSWPVGEFERILGKTVPELQGLKALYVEGTDASGRASVVRIDAEAGSTTMTGSQLRSLLGNRIIRSTAFTSRVEDGSVIIEGKGFGHGVGLCQFGANGLAGPPYSWTFDRILKHYYRGVEIVRIGDR